MHPKTLFLKKQEALTVNNSIKIHHKTLKASKLLFNVSKTKVENKVCAK